MLGDTFPNSAASRVAAAHREQPHLSAIELASRLGVKVRTVRSAAYQRRLELPTHRAPKRPEFKRIGYAGQEQGW